MSSFPLSPAAIRWAIFALAVGGFGIGTGEFVMMGLMPDVGVDLAITEPQVGHLISAYAMGVVVGAPVLAILGARMPRRRLLMVLMAMFAVGNFMSILVPGYLPIMAMRFASGLPHGAYFGVAALLAASMVGPTQRGRAIGQVMLGITLSALIGNPLATWLGQWLRWRAAFALVGAIGLLTMLLVTLLVPEPHNERPSSARGELSALRNGQMWMLLAIGAVGFGGLFSVFSYIAPTLTQVTLLDKSWVPVGLALFGMGMIGGNLVGGWLADRALIPSIGIVLVWSIVVLSALPFTAPHAWLALPNMLLVGSCVALVSPLQIRLMDVAADAQTLAASLNHSAFNVANALGAWLGGMAIAHGYGWTSTAWVGAALAAGGLVIFALSLWQTARARRFVTA
ncbi:MAG: MFS transporter [Burkholderiaceae bacterium]|nr:MFS transporter [Burkholderiaceae bacterium]